ncbi:MAG: hypothetical protein HY706_08370 [Candidatus Hydrogenedentes bacterium]|nr:hypothetical protein [Candidatus Hydrogenedentota bacterium]
MSIWEGSANLDYARRDDLAELIQGYYVPRLKAWRDKLVATDPEAWSQADDRDLEQTYWDLGQIWVNGGVQMSAPASSAIHRIEEILPQVREIEGDLPRPAIKPANLDFHDGLNGGSLSSRRMTLSFEPSAGPDGGTAFRFCTWPGSSGGQLYLFQTVQGSDAEISLDFLPESGGESSFAGLRVEAYDRHFHRVAECTYQWGNAWNYWPDRYRADNVTPDWNVGATGFLWWWVGHYAIKHRLTGPTGTWQHLDANPRANLDRVHGAGTWDGLHVKSLRVALIASTRRPEDPLAGAFVNLNVRMFPK